MILKAAFAAFFICIIPYFIVKYALCGCVKFKCKNHDILFRTSVWSVLNEFHQCPKCKLRGVSKMEKEVVEFIRSVYSGEIVENSRGLIPPYELDIYMPEKNLAIEFCGLYWHSTANAAGYKKNLHRDKALLCQEKGIKLFLFFEDEWIGKRELVQQMIKYRLGLIKNKVHARKCEINEFKNKDLKEFFQNNHIDGHTNCTRGYGLVYDGKIMAAMSIRTNFKGETEIARFATDRDTIVAGAGSRLISLLPRPIISFSNNRLSDGKIYRDNGFEEITQTTQPSYFYTDLKSRVWRFKCKRLNPPKITQEEFDQFPTETSQATNGIFSRKIFGDLRPLYRIEDASHKKWRLQ